MAKGITNATVPMGAVGVKYEIYETLKKIIKIKSALSWLYIFRSPISLCCRYCYVRSLSREKLFENAKKLESILVIKHTHFQANMVKDVRNIGLVAGIELDSRTKDNSTLGEMF